MTVTRVGKIVCMVLAVSMCTAVLAAPRGSRTSQEVAVEPGFLVPPITRDNGMRVCVSGFERGDFVSIGVPFSGTPETHSILSFAQSIGSSGGFCIDAPPSWTQLYLQPGVYTIQTVWHRGGKGHPRFGPTTTFQVAQG